MKTIEQWLKTLPEPLRSEAIGCSSKWILEQKKEFISDAIASAFTWCWSPSGQDFWQSLWEALSEAERLQ